MASIIDALRAFKQPEAIDRRAFHELEINPTDFLAYALTEQAFAQRLSELLCCDEMGKLISEGKVTVGMIKPRLDEELASLCGPYQRPIFNAVGEVIGYEQVVETIPSNDADLTDAIIDRIQPPLEVVLRVDVVMSPNMVNTFYEGKPKEKQVNIPPIEPVRYGQELQSRWQEFEALMGQGPVSFIILYSEQGDAIQQWRTHIGDDWNISRLRQKHPGSERAIWALDNNHNNVFHGSDSPVSVQREVSLLTEMLATHQ